MSNIYRKPYITDKTPLYFPYSREALMKKPIFPTYVFDGGAFFFSNDRLNATDGDALCAKVMSGEFFDYWQTEGAFDWFAVWKRFAFSGYNPEWEGHIFLARLYILLPLAQMYCRTKDEVYARKWYSILSDWIDQNPHTIDDSRPTDLVWRDMQVAWRTINIVHSIFLLDGCTSITQAEWQRVYDLIAEHGRQMYGEGLIHAQNHQPDNHRLQIGMALIMLGIFFPEFGHRDDYIATGKIIVEDNLHLSIYPDGVNEEDSITYCHFIARLYLEAELLLKQNGYDPIPGCRESIQKQYNFMYQFSSPAGKTLQIGDSYSMDALGDIAFVDSILHLELVREKRSILFPDSRMAVLRNETFALYIDAMDMTEWHQHYGRPHFVLFANGTALAIDSGSVNYDRGGLRAYINSAQAHNVITCDELPLERYLEKTDVCEQLSLDGCTLSGNCQSLTIRNRVAGGEKHYLWTRTFEMYPDRVEILDQIEASEPLHFTSYMHIPSSITGYLNPRGAFTPISEDCRQARIRRDTNMQYVSTDTPFSLEYRPCVNEQNALDYAVVLVRKFHTASLSERTVFRFDALS